MNVQLSTHLKLDRCPHCNVDKPSLHQNKTLKTYDCDEGNERYWGVYVCQRCGGVVVAWSYEAGNVIELFPKTQSVSSDLPERAKEYLKQAIGSKSNPSGAVMVCASSVKSMLITKGYKNGTLNERILKAVKDHLITDDMAKWAHEVRLDANYERHPDEKEPLPKESDAQKSIDFVTALGHILFTLPARVQRGLKDAKKKKEPNKKTEGVANQ